MKKKIKKSTWLTLALFVYVTVMAVYFLPRNTAVSENEKYISLAASYVIVGLLWWVLRVKEKRAEREKNEQQNNSNHLNNKTE